MSDTLPYPLLADAVLSLHVAIVVFVGGGLFAIIVGNLRYWRWVNALWFRAAHLAAILIVVAEAWAGAVCPLTTLEMLLRAKAGAATYAGSFIGHWLQRILYYDAPPWVFTPATRFSVWSSWQHGGIFRRNSVAATVSPMPDPQPISQFAPGGFRATPAGRLGRTGIAGFLRREP